MRKKTQKLETVSIVVPIYNEEKYIELLIDSILKQDYKKDNLEVVFVDGQSTDKTVELLKIKLKDSNLNYKIIYNPEKITPKSVNLGIKQSKNDIIIRLDAHSEYPENYISKCVYYLNNKNADNVGCLSVAKGRNAMGQAIAYVVSSKFGVGNSNFRTNAKSGYVDTVPFGTFRRLLFEKIGYFNEELIRSEDNEFNYRISKNGGKIYLFNDISTIYYPRDTILKLMKMGFNNGKWATYTGYIIPGSMGIRHFIPMLFVLGLLFGFVVSILNLKILTYMFICVLILYALLDLIFTTKNILKGGLKQIITLIIYPLFHISYGIGSVFGIGKIIKNKNKILER